MATKRHPTGTCIVCDLNRLDETKPVKLPVDYQPEWERRLTEGEVGEP